MKKTTKKEAKKEDEAIINESAAEDAGNELPETNDSIKEFIKVKKLQNEVLHKMLEKIQKSQDQSDKSNK
jgi:hypothetical protein